ncbi:MAG: succinate dehydrogenase [Amylibacter sp.]|nr:succinate dehydrogenase [Amylibacter sp.]
MLVQFIQRFALVFGLSFAPVALAYAQENAQCPYSPSILLQSCKGDISVRLRVLPDEAVSKVEHLLTVAGTYSSGDRFGIEGLVIKGGKSISRRYQNWDGVLIIDPNGSPKLFHAKNVTIDGEDFNLKERTLRHAFIAKAKAAGVTVLQSHLLITDGVLDLKDVNGAPRFKRRLFLTLKDGSFAIWETAQAETLYDAARQVQEELAPVMAFNLDMGAYDYCVSGAGDAQKDCGSLLVSKDKLTNLLEFSKG